MLELESRQLIINTPLQLTWHPMAVREKEQFWLEKHRKRVRGYEWLTGHDEPQKLHGSPNAQQECMRTTAGIQRVCISYIEMMSIYPGIFQIYTACR